MNSIKFDDKRGQALVQHYADHVLGNCTICKNHSWRSKNHLHTMTPSEHHIKMDSIESVSEYWSLFIVFGCTSCGHTELIDWDIAQNEMPAAGCIRCRTCKQDVVLNHVSRHANEPHCLECHNREIYFILNNLFDGQPIHPVIKEELIELITAANEAGIQNFRLMDEASIGHSVDDFGCAILTLVGITKPENILPIKGFISRVREFTPFINKK